LTLLVAVATLVLTVVLYIYAPKGFFLVQDTGLLLGVSEVSPRASLSALAERQQALARTIQKDAGGRGPHVVHRHRRHPPGCHPLVHKKISPSPWERGLG
jgi:multidrug efflux pump subunit AcrB